MSRPVLRLVFDVIDSIVLALVILALYLLFLGGGDVGEAAGESARLLFLFIDIGLGVWVVLLVIAVVRGRKSQTGPTAASTWLFALVGVVANLLTVTVVGFIQGGAAPWAFILFAIESGVALLIAAAIVVPIVHHLVKAV
jgi:hypothetical protein